MINTTLILTGVAVWSILGTICYEVHMRGMSANAPKKLKEDLADLLNEAKADVNAISVDAIKRIDNRNGGYFKNRVIQNGIY